MKNFYILFLCTVIIALTAQAQSTPSKIEKVTVYLEGAVIERMASVNLSPGENEISLSNLSPDIDESSIQISGLNESSISSLGYSINYLEKKVLSAEYKTIQLKIEQLQLQKVSLENTILGFEEEFQLLKRNQRINSDATDLALENVKEMSSYYRKRVTEIKNAIHKDQLAIIELMTQIHDHQNELAKLEDSKKEERGQINLKLEAKAAVNLVLTVKYKINTAGWFPLYDIRATDIASPIEFTYKANVYQQSGSDWENVNIVLSTGDPNTNNSKPKILPKYLHFVSGNYRTKAAAIRSSSYKYNPTIRTVSGTIFDNSGIPLPGANIIEKGTSNGTQSDFDGKYTIYTNGGRELVYSYVGFVAQNLPIYASEMNVTMEEDTNTLSEVVITGYAGNSARKEYDVSAMLEGKAAGLAGSASSIRIRGVNSLSTYNPLYVLDGVLVSENEISGLNSDDVADIYVLKGDEAVALYGSRAKSGVVIISMKKGTLSNGNSKDTGLTTTRFEISKKYSIPSNAKVTVIEVDHFSIPAKYQYYAAPEIDENVFLTATLQEWEQYDLLQGEANIYFEGSYAGKTFINPLATTDSLNLSLGVDPSIIITREKVDNYKSKSFLGGNRIISKGFQIQVKNNKRVSVNLMLEDRIPVSQNKEIKVDDLENGDAAYNESTGILTWKITLASEETSKKEYTYTVKYPKYKKINL